MQIPFIPNNQEETNELLTQLFSGHTPITAKIESIDDTDGYVMIGQLCLQWGKVTVTWSGSVSTVTQQVDFGIDYESTTGLMVGGNCEERNNFNMNTAIKEGDLDTDGVAFELSDINSNNPTAGTCDLFWWAVGIAKVQ